MKIKSHGMLLGVGFRLRRLGGLASPPTPFVPASPVHRRAAHATLRSIVAMLTLLVTLAGVARGELVRGKLNAATVEALRWQVALERAGFSPGVIDGVAGAKVKLATSEFQRARGMAATGRLDEETAAALGMDAESDLLVMHTVRAADLREVTGPLPKGWEARSKLKAMGYESAQEALAERFHCTRGLLGRLNPGLNWSTLKPGDVIWGLDLGRLREPEVDRLEVHQGEKVIRAFDSSGDLVALFHCSIAKTEGKRPAGMARVESVAMDPVYLFDPRMWPEVKDVKRKLTIPAGPRNPVGKCWIGLSLDGYGIHGTPNPEQIGKTGSHGCIRLANWDAQRLGRMVRPGAAVRFIKPSVGVVARGLDDDR